MVDTNSTFDSIFKVSNILFIIVPIIMIVIFGFMIALFFSPRLRAKLMGVQIKTMKHVITDNEQDLKDISLKSAEISEKGIEKVARTVKKGLTTDDEE